MQLSPVGCEPLREGRIPISSPLATIPVPWGLLSWTQLFPAEPWAGLWAAEPVFGYLWRGMVLALLLWLLVNVVPRTV